MPGIRNIFGSTRPQSESCAAVDVNHNPLWKAVDRDHVAMLGRPWVLKNKLRGAKIVDVNSRPVQDKLRELATKAEATRNNEFATPHEKEEATRAHTGLQHYLIYEAPLAKGFGPFQYNTYRYNSDGTRRVPVSDKVFAMLDLMGAQPFSPDAPPATGTLAHPTLETLTQKCIDQAGNLSNKKRNATLHALHQLDSHLNSVLHARVHEELVDRSVADPDLKPLYLGLFFGLASMADRRLLSSRQGISLIGKIYNVKIEGMPLRAGDPNFRRLGHDLAIRLSAIEHAMLHQVDNLRRRQGYVESFGKVTEVVGGTFPWTGGAAIAISKGLSKVGELVFSTGSLDIDAFGKAIDNLESTIAHQLRESWPQLSLQFAKDEDAKTEATVRALAFSDAFNRARRTLVRESNALRKAAGSKILER